MNSDPRDAASSTTLPLTFNPLRGSVTRPKVCSSPISGSQHQRTLEPPGRSEPMGYNHPPSRQQPEIAQATSRGAATEQSYNLGIRGTKRVVILSLKKWELLMISLAIEGACAFAWRNYLLRHSSIREDDSRPPHSITNHQSGGTAW